MSLWEGEVKRAFYPDEMQAKLPIKYGRWLQMFALSISWRALTYLKHSTKNPYVSLSSSAEELLPSIPSEIHDVAEACRLEWGNALLLGQASSSQSDQHLLFLNGKNFPYERSSVVGFTVCISASIVAVVSQLGPCCVVGILRDERPLEWKNTRFNLWAVSFMWQNKQSPKTSALGLRVTSKISLTLTPNPSFQGTLEGVVEVKRWASQ